MTRILHTADLHLAADHPERWEAFDAVLDVAREERADALLVAGDLLDRAGDHAALRAEVRSRLDEAGVPAFLLPGNHDREAYRPGQDWGGVTSLLLGEPLQVTAVGDVRLIGLPYPRTPVTFASVRRRVVERVETDARHVLALHGTLVDAADPHIREESREDEPGDYFPVRTADLRGVGVDYVALGHYHQPDVRRIGRTTVAYPGSPAPVGSHAWGKRSVVVVDAGEDGVDARAVELPVPYRRRVTRWLTPFEELQELDALERELKDEAEDDCDLRLELDGVLAGISEQRLRQRAEELAAELREGYREVELRLAGVGLEPALADLFRDFRRRLEEREEAGPGSELGRRALEIGARALKAS